MIIIISAVLRTHLRRIPFNLLSIFVYVVHSKQKLYASIYRVLIPPFSCFYIIMHIRIENLASLTKVLSKWLPRSSDVRWLENVSETVFGK